MDYVHEPVMLAECLKGLNIRSNGVYVDGTLGGAGHSFKIAQLLSAGKLIGFDQDREALEVAKARLSLFGDRVICVNKNFEKLDEVLDELGIERIDGMLMDLGCSSYQLDNPDRGFSYMNDGPLDMRMNVGSEKTAAEVVNGYSRDELAEILKVYGEERWADRIAEFIVMARPLSTTYQLVEVIKNAIPAAARRRGPHPAKRSFQAIRIEVNDELGVLARTIDSAIKRLSSGGRLCIISFHSLEDRIVKNKFRESGENVITKRPLTASDEEVAKNPRSRSAKLRILEKSIS